MTQKDATVKAIQCILSPTLSCLQLMWKGSKVDHTKAISKKCGVFIV